MNAKARTDVELILTNVRLSYAYLFKPYAGKRDDGSVSSTYCVHAIMTPDNPILAKVREAQRQVAKAAWGEVPTQVPDPTDPSGVKMKTVPAWEAVMLKLAQQDKLCLHNGNISKQGEAEYAGKFYVSANNSKKQPTIFAASADPSNPQVPLEITNNPGHKEAPYGGCWANVKVSIYAQSPNGRPSKWGQRINAQLEGVQFLKHDTAFGGGKVASASEFGVAAAADADAPISQPSGDDSGLI